eukprot:677842-Amphidinium_carterae.1
MQSLVDSLAEKSTSTLRIRALDLGRFLGWAMQHDLDEEKITELVAYQYTAHLRASGAARSATQRFTEALAFVKHTLGWQLAEDVLTSRRISGAAFRCTQDLPPVKRSHPFPP